MYDDLNTSIRVFKGYIFVHVRGQLQFYPIMNSATPKTQPCKLYCVEYGVHTYSNIHRLCRKAKPGEMTTKLEVKVILQNKIAKRELILHHYCLRDILIFSFLFAKHVPCLTAKV